MSFLQILQEMGICVDCPIEEKDQAFDTHIMRVKPACEEWTEPTTGTSLPQL
jgi:hypothetical protein